MFAEGDFLDGFITDAIIITKGIIAVDNQLGDVVGAVENTPIQSQLLRAIREGQFGKARHAFHGIRLDSSHRARDGKGGDSTVFEGIGTDILKSFGQVEFRQAGTTFESRAEDVRHRAGDGDLGDGRLLEGIPSNVFHYVVLAAIADGRWDADFARVGARCGCLHLCVLGVAVMQAEPQSVLLDILCPRACRGHEQHHER